MVVSARHANGKQSYLIVGDRSREALVKRAGPIR
jgi:hypothetical protein